MDSLNISDIISLAGVVIAFTTPLCGLIAWYVHDEKKKYGATRDFNHLRGSVDQLTHNINFQTRELDKGFDQLQQDILEIKVYLGMKSLRDDS